MSNANEIGKINVICTGRTQNRQILHRLKLLGYTYNSGDPIDPDNIAYSFRREDEDGKIIRSNCYAINEANQTIAYNSSYAMMLHKILNDPVVSFTYYNARLEHHLKEGNER